MLRIVSWNIHQLSEPWQMLADSDIDIALLQEAKSPHPELEHSIEVDPSTPWKIAGVSNRPFCAAIARFSDRVTMMPRKLCTVAGAELDALAVSRMGTLAVADIDTGDEVVTVASMYGAWEDPVQDVKSSWIYADASVHRIISDLSTLIGRQQDHKIITAGDLNILYGYGEHGSPYWKARYDTVFARMEAIGLPFVGPQTPDGGEQASPWPDELPTDSKNVPTYRTDKKRPETATRQMDFVFASRSLKDRLRVRAMNFPNEWGPSDHCRILIELE